MLKKIILGTVLVVFGAVLVDAEGTKFLRDYPGKVQFRIETKNTNVWRLSPSDAKAFHEQLERLGQLLAAQSVLKSPKGVDIRARAFAYHPSQWAYTSVPAQPNAHMPVASLGLWGFGHWLDVDGKPIASNIDAEMQVMTNSPEMLLQQAFLGWGGKVRDSRDNAMAEQWPRLGEIQGFPLYSCCRGGNLLVMTRSHKPYWLPVSQEEYLQAMIRIFEKKQAKDPNSKFYSQLLEHHRAALAQMTPVQRAAQARYFKGGKGSAYDPYLAPWGSSNGNPIIVPNPDFLDRSLPVSAIQIIGVKFLYGPHFNPDRPNPLKDDPASIRLNEMRLTADWRAISTILAK